MQKTRRGRPRSYDPDQALDAALAVFRVRGFDAASLEALGEAMGMSRPSLYAAFGDKRALLEHALARFRARMADGARRALSEPDAERALRGLLAHVIDVYAPEGSEALGCLLFGVASVRAVEDERLRSVLAEAIAELDDAIQRRLVRAVADGQLAADADPLALAQLVVCVIHGLSVRARAGAGREALCRLAASSVALIIAGHPS